MNEAMCLDLCMSAFSLPPIRGQRELSSSLSYHIDCPAFGGITCTNKEFSMVLSLSRRGKRWPSGIISAMSAQPPPKSFASLLWDIIRLGVRALWENRANPARTLLERQQALAVLGLPPNATRQQIKRRYRSLAKRYHPDRGGDQQQMRRIIAAYELLMRDQPKTQSE